MTSRADRLGGWAVTKGSRRAVKPTVPAQPPCDGPAMPRRGRCSHRHRHGGASARECCNARVPALAGVAAARPAGCLRHRRAEPRSQTSGSARSAAIPMTGKLNRRTSECVYSGRASGVPGGHRRARRRGNHGPTRLPRMEARRLVARRCARRTGRAMREQPRGRGTPPVSRRAPSGVARIRQNCVVRVDRARENVFTVTATGQELSALVAGARLALDAMRASPDAPASAIELLEQVLADFDRARRRLSESPPNGDRR
jgi:hypothetical protein